MVLFYAYNTSSNLLKEDEYYQPHFQNRKVKAKGLSEHTLAYLKHTFEKTSLVEGLST